MKRKINIDVNTNKKIFIIVRLSTESDNETSLIDQKNFIIQKYNFNLLNKVDIEFIQFNGYSAFNTSYYTDTMNYLFQLKNKQFYFFSIDRFSRNLIFATQWLQYINNNNSYIYFAQEELKHPQVGDYRRIIDAITVAQQYSESISIKVKNAILSKKQRTEFTQSVAFGCSFNNKRIYELKIIVLIDLLKSIDHDSYITLYYLKNILKSIVLSMPIPQLDIINKINFIDNNDFYTEEQLSNKFSDLDICDLLSNYGIFIIKNNNDSYFEIQIVNDDYFNFNYYSDYFYWTHFKDMISYINQSNLDFYLSKKKFNNFKLNDISSLILKLNNKIDNLSSRNKLSNKIISLNKEFYPQLKSKSKILVGTWFKIPKNLLIPKLFQFREKRNSIDKKNFYLFDKIKNKFNHNIKINDFKDKFISFKQSFLSQPINDELISLMCNSLSISNQQDQDPEEDQDEDPDEDPEEDQDEDREEDCDEDREEDQDEDREEDQDEDREEDCDEDQEGDFEEGDFEEEDFEEEDFEGDLEEGDLEEDQEEEGDELRKKQNISMIVENQCSSELIPIDILLYLIKQAIKNYGEDHEITQAYTKQFDRHFS